MTVFLKQYGARRTGTNYLRWLIRSNYAETDVVALMHILGDKHSPQPPLGVLWQEAQVHPDPALAFAVMATLHKPADSTEPHNPRQRAEVERFAEALARAYVEDALGFLISIKDPYAWTVSVARFYCWTDRVARLGPHLLGPIVGQCKVFNDCYASWFALAREKPDRCLVVRHEDLLAEPERVLGELDAKFGIRRSTPELLDLPDEAFPIWWDQHQGNRTGVPFDRAYYRDRRYLDRLSPPIFDAVTKAIDWNLVAPLGYAPIRSAP